MKNIINIIIGCLLIFIGVYVFLMIPKIVDFSIVIIRLEDNDRIYQFLVYLPVIITIFSGLLALVNVVLRNNTLSVMNLLVSAGIVIYLLVDYLGFVEVSKGINNQLIMIKNINIAACIMLITSLCLNIKNKKIKEDSK